MRESLVALVLALGALVLAWRRQRRALGRWGPGRPGWSRARVTIDGADAGPYCVGAHTIEGWVDEHRPAKHPRDAVYVYNSKVVDLMERDPATGQAQVFRRCGTVRVIVPKD